MEKILGNNEVIYSRSLYGTDKEIKEEYYNRCKNYIYPIVHNMIKEYGLGFVYSNENKVILSFGRYQYPYNDYEGKYGMVKKLIIEKKVIIYVKQ